MSLYWLSTAALLTGFCTVLTARLRASQFKWSEAMGLAVLGLAQPAYVGHGALRAGFLALAAYAVTASGQAFVERQDPKRIVFFGSSLAGAQLASPVWGVVASLTLPLVVRRSLPAFEPARLAGLYTSLFFIPALMALTLLGLFVAGQMELPHWPAQARRPTLEGARHLLSIIVLTLPLLLAVKFKRPKSPNFVAVPVCAIMAGTSTAIELLGFHSGIFRLQYGAAVTALTILVVSGWNEERWRLRFAVLAVGASPIFCWILKTMDLGAAHV